MNTNLPTLYHGIFDIMDETNDDIQFDSDELDRFYTIGHFKSMMNEEAMMDDENVLDLDQNQVILYCLLFSFFH